MSEVALTSAVPHGIRECRSGADAGEPGLLVSLRTEVATATVLARRGAGEALRRRVHETFGLDLPDTPRRVAADGRALIWAGPGQWLATAESTPGHVFEQQLRAALSGLASISDQTDGRAMFRIAGPRVRDVLAKGVLIDLHPRAFGIGDTALSVVGHIGVHFWQLDETIFEFAVMRSFAAAFWHWVTEAGAQFGVDTRREP